MNGSLELSGSDPLIAKLNALGRMSFANALLMAGGFYLARKFATYPPRKRPTRKSVYGTSFKTEKQRKYFFAALHKGEIDVPYRRGISPGSETLGRRWTVYSKSQFVVAVGNNASYARKVQSLQNQALYMAAVGWVPAETTLERERGNVLRVMERELTQEIAKMEG